METINNVLLCGRITTVHSIPEASAAYFEIRTFHAVGRGPAKKLIHEDHLVILDPAGTIGKYLKEGKEVTVQGRVVPTSREFPEPNILASHITFHGRGGND